MEDYLEELSHTETEKKWYVRCFILSKNSDEKANQQTGMNS